MVDLSRNGLRINQRPPIGFGLAPLSMCHPFDPSPYSSLYALVRIIKNKTHYIAGGGLEVVSGELARFIANPYSDFNMNEIVEQLAFDYELFGAFAVKGT